MSGGPRLGDYLKPGRTPWSWDYNNSDHADSHGCCIVCGKATKGNGITVILGEGGDTLILPENDEWQQANDAGYMGCWTVGPECGKDIPSEYRMAGLEA